jgi:hypothetical protein
LSIASTVDPDRPGEGTAMHHAPCGGDGGNTAYVEMLAEPAEGLRHDLSQVVRSFGFKIDFKGRWSFPKAKA